MFGNGKQYIYPLGKECAMAIEYKIRAAVCDDTPKDRELILGLLYQYLDERSFGIRVDEFASGEELLQADVMAYDLLILDIFMGELNGIETAKVLMERNPGAQIIFCSTSNEFAAESYDVSALRYLTKPVQKDKLFATLDRYFHAHTTLRTLNFKLNRMDEHVYLSDVLWIETGDHKCVIHTKKEQIVTRTSFAALCEQVKDADFVKPIRYALVSLGAVTTIPNDSFTLCDGSVIPISRELRADMKKAFTDYKMKTLLKKGGAWG